MLEKYRVDTGIPILWRSTRHRLQCLHLTIRAISDEVAQFSLYLLSKSECQEFATEDHGSSSIYLDVIQIPVVGLREVMQLMIDFMMLQFSL